MTSKLKAVGDCSSHHLRGTQTYCGGPTTGRTACYNLQEGRNFDLLHCALARCGLINRSCLWVCGCVCWFVCGSVTTITRNCMHRSSPNWVCK